MEIGKMPTMCSILVMGKSVQSPAVGLLYPISIDIKNHQPHLEDVLSIKK